LAKRRNGSVGLALAAISAVGSPVIAQNAQDLPPVDDALDDSQVGAADIVVTGQRALQESVTKIPLMLQQTPQAITVVTAADIERRLAPDLRTAIELTPGVVASGPGPFQGSSRVNFETALVRGQRLGREVSADLRVNGFRAASEDLPLDPALYERIEIIRGPSGTLYGGGSLAGFINRVTKKPQEPFGLDLEAQYGSFAFKRLEFDATGNVTGDDKMLARFVAAIEDTGSFTEGVTRRRITFAPSVSVKLSGSTRILVEGQYTEFTGRPDVGLPSFLRGDKLVPLDVPRDFYFGRLGNSRVAAQQWQINGLVEQDVTEDWLASIYLQKGRSNSAFRADAYGYTINDNGDTTLYSADSFRINEYWAGEFRLSGKTRLFGQEQDLIFGLERTSANREARAGYTNFGTANIYTDNLDQLPIDTPTVPVFGLIDVNKTTAIYSQMIFTLEDRTRLIAGIRHDWAERTARGTLQTDSTGGRRNKATYRVALSHDITPGLTAFAAYATSFLPVADFTRTGQPIQPETGKGIELGVKFSLINDKLSGAASLYQQDRENVPIGLPRFLECPMLPSCADSGGMQRTEGIEVELVAKPLSGFSLAVSAAFMNNRFTDPDDPNFGLRPTSTVDSQYSAFAAFEFARGSDISLTYLNIGKRSGTFIGQFADGYDRLDLAVNIALNDDWQVAGLVRNITDNVYYEEINQNNASYFGAPRAFLVQLRYSPGSY